MKRIRNAGFLLVALAACGSPEEARHAASKFSEEWNLTGVDMSQVTMTADGAATLTPAAPPQADGSISEIAIEFGVKIDSTRAADFKYDKSSWKLGFRKIDGNGDIIELGGTVLSGGDAAAASSGSATQVKLSVALAGGRLPADVEKLLADAATTDQRRTVQVVAIYRTGDSKDQDKRLSFPWAADRGVMIGGPAITGMAPSDGTLVVEWGAPTKTAALARQSDGSLSQEPGSSTVSGYVVMLWRQGECEKGGWSFRANGEVEGKEPGRGLTCSYAGSEAASTVDGIASGENCSLGCSTTASSSLGGKSEDEAAVPANIPTENGRVQQVGCYQVVRVSAAKRSFSFGGLKNDVTYGVVAWALDSSGHLSLGRSSCGKARPLVVPLPGDFKTGGVKKTESDCFVATAASGNTMSPSVVSWRILRDRVLGDGAFVRWYYREGPHLARWLREHPALRAPVNAILEASGTLGVRLLNAVDSLRPFWLRVRAAAERLDESLFGGVAFGAPEVPVGSQFTILGGTSDMTTDGKYWDAFYRPSKPWRIALAHSFTLLDFSAGELGVGAEFGYMWARGKTPKTLPGGAAAPAATVGMLQTADGFSAAVLGSGRLFVPGFPWLALHGTVSGGLLRLRMEATRGGNADASAGSGGPLGYTFWKPLMGVRLAGEFFWGDFFHQEMAAARFGVGLRDVALVGFGEFSKDFSSSLSVDGLILGGGLSFLFD